MIPGYLLAAISAFCMLYYVFPTLFFRLFRKPHLRTRNAERRIILTFDDGPDEEYTEKLLTVLEENNVHAMFFVVAQKAAQFPELIIRIRDGGHILAMHSLAHKSPWCKSFGYLKNDFEKSLEILKGFGCDMRYYRPRWGHFSLPSIYLVRKHHLKLMLWTVMVQDWEKDSTCDRVLSRLKSRVKNGSVICLHDSGKGTGGADNGALEMIHALKTFLPEMLQNGYRFILPDEDKSLS